MDFSVDITPTLGPAKDYIVAFGHLKLIRDRSNMDKNKSASREMKKSTASKLPRKTHFISSYKKKNPKLNDQTNISGYAAGTSKQTNPKLKLERSGEEKYKPSLIPRRKSNPKETPSREPSTSSIKSFSNRIEPNIQQKNVQRVQLLNINPEFFREVRSPPKSVISARPIPTLGHIYRQDLSNDTFTDWFLESVDEFRESYDNSIEITSTENDNSATTSVNNNAINNLNTTDVTKLRSKENSPATLNIFKTTNENVSEWLSTELDHPTRDNESGYRSLSPMSKISLTNIQDEKYTIFQKTEKKTSSNNIPAKESVSDTLLSTQPTVIIKKKKKSNSSRSIFAIPKINTDIKQHDYYPDFHKPLKYHSTPNPPRKRETIDQNPAASYVEYPSEVLQKTTNFETDGCDNLSSAIETGRGNLSSQSTLRGNTDSNFTFNGMDWSKLHSSQDTFKRMSTCGSWRSNGFDDKHGTLTSEKNSYHDYCYHYCWRKEVAKKDVDEQSLWDYRGRCKRCHKYRRAPSRKKLGQRFRYLRKRMTIGVCRHRLNRVWKKTTEKWAHWSKSPSKLRRLRMMNYLQKSIIWDNANVQTTIFVYNETGTDAVAREQKSAEITASLKLNSRSYKKDTSEISDSIRTPPKHANIGPSMFPFLHYSSNNTLVLGKTSDQSKMSFGNDMFTSSARVKEIKSINTQYSNMQKNTFEEVLETSATENKVLRRLIDLSSMKLKHAVSQDAYTQVVIMCNNADTNILFTPTVVNHPEKSPPLSQDLLYYGVDEETDPIIITEKISKQSINVMTSKRILQGLTNIETQVSPSVSLRKISTGILARDMYQDTKSSVITDTTVPCRRFENKLITSKGTILSCTGTKITSVSSANIQTTSTISKILRPLTVNTAVSTFVNTKHIDCSTAPSLYKPKHEDVLLETDDLEVMKSEKSTSQIHLDNHLDVGVSASDVIDRTSFNCGSHHTQYSFGATIQPDYNSVVMNTEVEPVSAFTSLLGSDQRSKAVDNCETQYSSFLKEGSWSQDRCQRMRIGRSRLLSVRPLLPDATDEEAQAQPSRLSAETKTTSNQKMSASVFTSRFAFGDRQQKTLDADHVFTLTRAQIGSDNEAGTVPCHDNEFSVVDRVSSKPSQRSKHPSVLSNKQKSRVKSRPTSAIISSHLDANKWINESAKENKNIHSILTASASTVNESLERAVLVASSADKLTAPEIHQLSKALVNPQPAINCVTAKPYGHVSSNSLAINVSRILNKSNQPVVSESKSPTLTADKVTSDEVVVKDVKESILQVRPDLCDTETDCAILHHKSASVLTSRHVLPKNACCAGKDANNDIDCLFVYDRPRCVIHSYYVDAAIQMQSSQKDKVHTKRSPSQRSIGIATSLPCQVCCNRKSEGIGEVLPPRMYKAIYDTTKLVTKEGSDSRSSRHSSNESTFSKGETEEANKMTSHMTSCMGMTLPQCCCMRCIQIEHTHRSIQAVKNSFQHCPNCNAKITELQKVNSDTMEDCVRSHLAASCRYYSNLLTMKLGQMKDKLRHHLAQSYEESTYPLTVPNVYAEAFTMKPSGKQDENCEAKIINTHSVRENGEANINNAHNIYKNCEPKINNANNILENCEAKIETHKIINNSLNRSCYLSPATSAMDLRGHDKKDLKTVYYILSAIEGRVRRLKSNLVS